MNIGNISKENDLRKTRADEVDRILWRMELLEPKDRLIMELYYKHEATHKQLATLINRSDRTIAQHIAKQTQRLLCDAYVTVIQNAKMFSSAEKKIAYDHYLLGLGYRRISAKRSLKQCRVREILRRLQAWVKRQKAEREHNR